MGKIQLKQALERLNEVTEQLRIAQARIEETGKAENASTRFCQSQQETTEEEQKRARKSMAVQQQLIMIFGSLQRKPRLLSYFVLLGVS